ncbi:hypothetical protein predicted by Glimmer/Critica [Lactiplantibacillus plantarum]|nr:hypothetical protein predicted by Glimmer/Critica [Lactiplantibacillus plantarum]
MLVTFAVSQPLTLSSVAKVQFIKVAVISVTRAVSQPLAFIIFTEEQL